MATVTGSVKDFGLVALTGTASTRVRFIPSGPGINVLGSAFAGKPGAYVEVTPTGDGSFSANLAPTEGLDPLVWYTLEVSWMVAGQRQSVVFPQRLTVPAAGGTLGSLPGVGSTTGGVAEWEAVRAEVLAAVANAASETAQSADGTFGTNVAAGFTGAGRFKAVWRGGWCQVHVDFTTSAAVTVLGTLPAQVPVPLARSELMPSTGAFVWVDSGSRTVEAYNVPTATRFIVNLLYAY